MSARDKVILGIDPGKTGAMALLYGDGSLYVEDAPALGKELNGAGIAAYLKEFKPDLAIIESVNSFGMGRQSAFNFGQGVGVYKGVLAALSIPFVAVTPAKWKKHYALGKDKEEARAAATRLFPDRSHLFLRKKDADRAEAALIALWASQQESVMR